LAILDKASALEQLETALLGGVVPHNTALGLKGVDIGPGYVVIKLPYSQALVGNPWNGVIHGGAITALLDATSGIAVFTKLNEARRIATLDLRIDYLSPARPDRELFARAECYKATRNVAFVRGVAYHEDPASPIAASAATFMIFRDRNSSMGIALDGK
jgi:uncharacterized protein (TIGR00369 family)